VALVTRPLLTCASGQVTVTVTYDDGTDAVTALQVHNQSSREARLLLRDTRTPLLSIPLTIEPGADRSIVIAAPVRLPLGNQAGMTAALSWGW